MYILQTESTDTQQDNKRTHIQTVQSVDPIVICATSDKQNNFENRQNKEDITPTDQAILSVSISEFIYMHEYHISVVFTLI